MVSKVDKPVTLDLAALMNPELAVPQQWGLAIQKHPANVPAIKFKSRFTGSACLAIFDRDAIAAKLRATSLGPLEQVNDALDWLTKNDIALV